MSKNTLLINMQTFKDRSPVHKGMDESLILPAIKVAQDTRIVPAIGTNLMERLQTGIEDANLTADENALLDNYIVDALIQFTLAGLPYTSYQFFTKGVLRVGNENSELPSLSDLKDIARSYENTGEFYRERLVKYLRDNRSLFTTYTTGCDNDISPTCTGYSPPMWLGDNCDDCNC